MKSILLKGASHSGKSTTIKEVCKKLNLTKVYKLHINESKLVLSSVEEIFNNTFVIEVKGKWVLIVAGAPAEQNVCIRIIIEVCIKLKLDIHFALVAMRSFEKRKDSDNIRFDTISELKNYSEIVLIDKIHRINESDFQNNEQWKKRINKIVEIIEANI